MSGACIHDKENIRNAFNEENSQGISVFLFENRLGVLRNKVAK